MMKKVLIPVIFSLVTLGASALFAGSALAGQSVNEMKDASANGFVKINVVRGELRIEGWDRNKVSVVGTLDEKMQEFIFDSRGSDTIITVRIPRSNNSWCCHDGSDLHIKVPVGSKVEVGGVSLDLRVENISGGIEVGNVSGDIQVMDVSDRVRISSVSGEVELRNAKGRIRVKSVSGEIEVRNAHGQAYYHSVSGGIHLSNVSDELDIETVSGDIEVTDGQIVSIRGSSVSGDIDLEVTMSDRASIDFETISGTIRLRLDGNTDARYDLETASGSIRNRLTNDKPRHSKYVRDETLRFAIGDGDGEVVINTRSGDIVVGHR